MCTRYLLYTPVLFIFLQINAQVRWDGDAADGQWATAANWVGDIVPDISDNVLLDNSLLTGNYTVSLPGAAASITIRTIVLLPAAGNTIQLLLPASSTAAPALTATGPGYGITIYKGGVLLNASGTGSGAAIAISDSFRIYNGGQYIHNTRSAHAAMVTVLSRQPGTETGIFTFDAPGGGYTFASTNRVYGTLQLSADASGGNQVYATSAASPLTINGDLIIKAGATVNLDITAATTIKGNYLQAGGVFNLASQANSNTVYIKGNFLQAAGLITETSTGLPGIELNGTGNQNIQLAGIISNNVDFSINNSTGVSLLSAVSFPYRLRLLNGIVHSQSFMLTLLPGCSIQADSLTSTNFVTGAIRKEGLTANAHFLFPVGKGITQRWMALKNVTGNYTVEFFKSNPRMLAAATGAGIHHISAIEYWQVKSDPAPAPVNNVELSFNDVNSGGVTDMATLRVAQLQAGTWTDKGNTSTTGSAGSAGSVISNSVSGLDAEGSYFCLASSDAFQNPLPLTGLSFTGVNVGGGVFLNWITDQALQPAYFELLASEDGIAFLTLSKTVAIKGQRTYQFTDGRKLSGKQYYRLRLVEKDGAIFYANEIVVTVSANSSGSFQLRPSVIKDNASLFVAGVNDRQVQINLYNMAGIQMQSVNLLLHPGNNHIPFTLPHLAAGLYTMVVTCNDGKTETRRFMKVN